MNKAPNKWNLKVYKKKTMKNTDKLIHIKDEILLNIVYFFQSDTGTYNKKTAKLIWQPAVKPVWLNNEVSMQCVSVYMFFYRGGDLNMNAHPLMGTCVTVGLN